MNTFNLTDMRLMKPVAFVLALLMGSFQVPAPVFAGDGDSAVTNTVTLQREIKLDANGAPIEETAPAQDPLEQPVAFGDESGVPGGVLVKAGPMESIVATTDSPVVSGSGQEAVWYDQGMGIDEMNGPGVTIENKIYPGFMPIEDNFAWHSLEDLVKDGIYVDDAISDLNVRLDQSSAGIDQANEQLTLASGETAKLQDELQSISVLLQGLQDKRGVLDTRLGEVNQTYNEEHNVLGVKLETLNGEQDSAQDSIDAIHTEIAQIQGTTAAKIVDLRRRDALLQGQESQLRADQKVLESSTVTLAKAISQAQTLVNNDQNALTQRLKNENAIAPNIAKVSGTIKDLTARVAAIDINEATLQVIIDKFTASIEAAVKDLAAKLTAKNAAYSKYVLSHSTTDRQAYTLAEQAYGAASAVLTGLKNNKEYRTDISQMASLTATENSSINQIAGQNHSLADWNKKLAAAHALTVDAQNRLAADTGNLDAARQKLAAAQTALADIKKKLPTLDAEEAAVANQIKQASADQTVQLVNLGHDLQAAQADYDALGLQIADINGAVLRLDAGHKQQVSDIQLEIGHLEIEVQNEQGHQNEVQGTVKDALARRDVLSQKIEALKLEMDAFSHSLEENFSRKWEIAQWIEEKKAELERRRGLSSWEEEVLSNLPEGLVFTGSEIRDNDLVLTFSADTPGTLNVGVQSDYQCPRFMMCMMAIFMHNETVSVSEPGTFEFVLKDSLNNNLSSISWEPKKLMPIDPVPTDNTFITINGEILAFNPDSGEATLTDEKGNERHYVNVSFRESTMTCFAQGLCMMQPMPYYMMLAGSISPFTEDRFFAHTDTVTNDPSGSVITVRRDWYGDLKKEEESSGWNIGLSDEEIAALEALAPAIRMAGAPELDGEITTIHFNVSGDVTQSSVLELNLTNDAECFYSASPCKMANRMWTVEIPIQPGLMNIMAPTIDLTKDQIQPVGAPGSFTLILNSAGTKITSAVLNPPVDMKVYARSISFESELGKVMVDYNEMDVPVHLTLAGTDGTHEYTDIQTISWGDAAPTDFILRQREQHRNDLLAEGYISVGTYRTDWTGTEFFVRGDDQWSDPAPGDVLISQEKADANAEETAHEMGIGDLKIGDAYILSDDERLLYAGQIEADDFVPEWMVTLVAADGSEYHFVAGYHNNENLESDAYLVKVSIDKLPVQDAPLIRAADKEMFAVLANSGVEFKGAQRSEEQGREFSFSGAKEPVKVQLSFDAHPDCMDAQPQCEMAMTMRWPPPDPKQITLVFEDGIFTDEIRNVDIASLESGAVVRLPIRSYFTMSVNNWIYTTRQPYDYWNIIRRWPIDEPAMMAPEQITVDDGNIQPAPETDPATTAPEEISVKDPPTMTVATFWGGDGAGTVPTEGIDANLLSILDVNRDGIANDVDYSLIKENSGGDVTLWVDANQDGVSDNADVELTQKYLQPKEGTAGGGEITAGTDGSAVTIPAGGETEVHIVPYTSSDVNQDGQVNLADYDKIVMDYKNGVVPDADGDGLGTLKDVDKIYADISGTAAAASGGSASDALKPYFDAGVLQVDSDGLIVNAKGNIADINSDGTISSDEIAAAKELFAQVAGVSVEDDPARQLLGESKPSDAAGTTDTSTTVEEKPADSAGPTTTESEALTYQQVKEKFGLNTELTIVSWNLTEDDHQLADGRFVVSAKNADGSVTETEYVFEHGVMVQK